MTKSRVATTMLPYLITTKKPMSTRANNKIGINRTTTKKNNIHYDEGKGNRKNITNYNKKCLYRFQDCGKKLAHLREQNKKGEELM